MKRHRLAALGLIAILFASAATAQVTLYQNERFHGPTFTVSGPVNNLDRYGFNDRASSLIIERGTWQVCEDSDFRGRCIELRPGQYPTLNAMGLNNRVSSLRRIPGPSYSYAPPRPPPPAYPYYPAYGETLYQANVVSARAVMGPPEQRCWTEPQQVVAPSQPNVPGAIIGGILGGVLGHQIGSGRGNDVATAVGAVGGAAVGANVNRGCANVHAERAAVLQRAERPGELLRRDLRVPRHHAPGAARVRAGADDHRQRPRRAARVAALRCRRTTGSPGPPSSRPCRRRCSRTSRRTRSR